MPLPRPSRARAAAVVASLASAALLAACGDDPSGPGAPRGSFSLVTTGAGPLPHGVTSTDLGFYYLISGGLEFDSDTTLTDIRVYQQYAGSPPNDAPAGETAEVRATFRYRRSGDTIFIDRPVAPIELSHVDTGVFADAATIGIRVQNPYLRNFQPVELIYQRTDP